MICRRGTFLSFSMPALPTENVTQQILLPADPHHRYRLRQSNFSPDLAGGSVRTGARCRPIRDRGGGGSAGERFRIWTWCGVLSSDGSFVAVFLLLLSVLTVDALAGSAIWTRDGAQAIRVSNKLDHGLVWVRPFSLFSSSISSHRHFPLCMSLPFIPLPPLPPVSFALCPPVSNASTAYQVNTHHRNDPSSPWGGYKNSGVGRENGHEAYHSYTQSKSVIVNYATEAESLVNDECVLLLFFPFATTLTFFFRSFPSPTYTVPSCLSLVPAAGSEKKTAR
jgi:hypothetical protein